MLLRKKKRVTSEVDLSEIPELDQAISSSEEKEKYFQLIEELIAKLKPEQKKSIELFFLEGKSYLEIADDLKLSLMQVKSAIQNGKRMLKISLGKAGINTVNL
jgi:RNA polymerase sigma-70 factor (ECF subfamily)